MPAPLRRLSVLAIVAVLVLVATIPAGAVAPDPVNIVGQNFVPPGVTGTVNVVVQLTNAPLAAVVGPNAKQRGPALNATQQQNYAGQLDQQQSVLSARLPGLGGTEVARLSKALNALVVRIDAARVPALAAQPGVRSVRLVRDYELDLSDTVPYIGATTVQNNGTDGTGIKVAVLDSGVDYTHRNLGGGGTLGDYTNAYGASPSDPANTTRGAFFPTAKVYDGYDFVGEVWPNGALLPDDDPIDYQGHGTHVADIIAGHSLDNTHKGVAPGATILAVKVCSAVATSCSGVALLQGIEYALDPNDDNNISDAVNVINMSLGTSYGQQEDDLSEASRVAVNFGVVVVASAGNSADRPYITGSPASTPEVISVAQTQVPSAKTFPLTVNSPSGLGPFINTNTVPWAPVTGTTTADVVYIGTACPGDTLATNPAGKIAIVLRATCSISLKVDVAADAGAVAVLVQNNAAGDPPSFSFGGGDTMVPTLVLTQADGNTLRTAIQGGTVNATISDTVFTSLAGSIVSTSSRGPDHSLVRIKPDIAAPGASLSAVAGTGDGEEAFGGTSGAAPMVAGSVALLLQAKPGRTPGEVKAVLMNTAETDILTNPVTAPGVPAPITRIGGGEVRIDRAIASQTAAWDTERLTGSLSFGYQAVSTSATFSRTVTVRNYANTARTYTIGHEFRYADDQASGAVTISTPGTLNVPANGSATFTVQLSVDASKLPFWTFYSGIDSGNGPLLQSVEFDGYITIDGGGDDAHVAWHVLPHKAANVTPVGSTNLTLRSGRGSFTLGNTGGAVAGAMEVFSLTGTSPQLPGPPPAPGSNQARIDLKAVGVRLADNTIEFGITTWGERSHPAYPAQFSIEIDTDRNGSYDYVIFNAEVGTFASSGQVAAFYAPTGAPTANAQYYVAAALNSANILFKVPLAGVGLTAGQQFNFRVTAYDNYFTGIPTDNIGGTTPMTYTLATPRYTMSGLPPGGVPIGGATTVTIRSNSGGGTASPGQSGFLLLYWDGKPGREAEIVTITP